ncbi:LPS assembly lipoprotein LptE [Isosphaeraceae bacterium EP7]
MNRPNRPTRRALLALGLSMVAGCGYSVRPPFDKSIRTIYVPVFRSVTFKRDVNFQLTELVKKEIANRTPFKLVNDPDAADTILDGEVNFADKNLIVESPFNLPRLLNAVMTVSVNWTDNRDNPDKKPVPPALISEAVNFAPELGETAETAFYKVNQKLAIQIVGMMEQRW